MSNWAAFLVLTGLYSTAEKRGFRGKLINKHALPKLARSLVKDDLNRLGKPTNIKDMLVIAEELAYKHDISFLFE